MNALQIDPKTGYLDADNWNSFGAEKKVKFLELAQRSVKEEGKWPDMAKLCDMLGIDPRTLDRHLQIDPKFKEEFESIKIRGKWKLESLMYELSSKSPLYMFGWLRKWYPAEYNPEYRVTSTVDVNIIGTLSDRAQAIETEIVQPPTTKEAI